MTMMVEPTLEAHPEPPPGQLVIVLNDVLYTVEVLYSVVMTDVVEPAIELGTSEEGVDKEDETAKVEEAASVKVEVETINEIVEVDTGTIDAVVGRTGAEVTTTGYEAKLVLVKISMNEFCDLTQRDGGGVSRAIGD